MTQNPRDPRLPTFHPEMGFPVYAMPQYPQPPQNAPVTPSPGLLDSGFKSWVIAGSCCFLGFLGAWIVMDALYGGKDIRALQASYESQIETLVQSNQGLQSSLDSLETEIQRIRGCVAPQ